MTFNNDPSESVAHPLTLTGRSVFDSRQVKAGKVTDVLYEDGRPGWAVVKTGPLRGEHLMPLQQSYVDSDGRLNVPFDKADIQHAPRIGRDHVLTRHTRLQLSDHYGIAA